MCLCVRKKFLLLKRRKFLFFVQTFTKRRLNYLVAVTQNLAKTGERFLRFEMEPCFSVRYVYLLVAPHFQFRFHVWWNCFSGKKQFNDRPLSNSFSVAVEEKFKKFLVFSLIQWTEVDERFYIYTICWSVYGSIFSFLQRLQNARKKNEPSLLYIYKIPHQLQFTELEKKLKSF